MQTNEGLQHYRRLLQDLRSLGREADQVLLTDPEKAQELYQQLDKRTNDLLIVQDSALLLDVTKFRTHVYWGMGHAAFLQGNYDSAIRAFHAALAQIVAIPNEEHIGPLRGLCNTYMQLGQADKAKIYSARAFDEASTLQRWNDAVRARFQMAQCDFNLGDRDSFLNGLQEARELAEESIAAESTTDNTRQELRKSKHEIEMHELQFRLTLDPTGEFMHRFRDPKLRKEMLKDDSVEDRIAKLSLAANWAVQQREYESAKDWLDHARTLAQDNNLLASQWSVLMNQARLYDEQGDLKEAIDSAVEAVATTRKLPAKTGKAPLESALQLLISLQYESGDPQQISEANDELDELKRIGNMTTVAPLEAARAMIYYRQGQYEQALQSMDEVEKEDIELEIRRRLLMPKTAILQSQGRLEEALQVNLLAIKLYHQSLVTPSNPAISNWIDMVREVGSFYANTALLTLKLNRPREALEWIDKAKAQILRTQLAQSDYGEDSAYQELNAVTFQEIQALLSTDGAAIAIYTLSANSSAVYVYNAAEKESEPQRLSLSFSLQDLQKALPPAPNDGYSYQRDPYKAVLPQLSAWLLHPLREIVNTCSVLCIVPDSLLAGIPFAALECEDVEGVSRPLIEHCAVGFVPAVAILQWCRQRVVERVQHRCLAFGVGSAPDGDSTRQIEFAAQVEEIVALFNSGGWESRSLPEATTASDFFAQAESFPIVHLACHGIIEKSEPDTLLASYLEFAHKHITAKDIFESHLQADLVFLNACVSGDFQSRLVREVGGFWQAFLHAGAGSLIAPQIKVHPAYAQEVATRFYTEWLKGNVTKAQALRLAQLQMRERGIETVHWSHHILVGDYR